MISNEEIQQYRKLIERDFFNAWVVIRIVILLTAAVTMLLASKFGLSVRFISWIGCAYLLMLLYQEVRHRLELMVRGSVIHKLLDDRNQEQN